MLPKFTDGMFLESPVEAYVEHVRSTQSKHLDLALRINRLAHRALFEASVSMSSTQQVVLGTLLQRALKAYQAAIILFQHGLPEEGLVATRTLIEITFKIAATAKDASVAESFVNDDEAQRQKFARKYKSLSSHFRDPQSLTQIDQEQSAKFAASGRLSTLTTQWFAERAGMLDFYNTAYAVLSSEVHATVRSVERALQLNSNGEVEAIQYGFSDRGFSEHVFTAMEALVLSVRAAFSTIEISQASVDAIHSFHDELNRAFEQRDGA